MYNGESLSKDSAIHGKRGGEKDTFNDKQSPVAERNTGGEQGPGDRSKEAAWQIGPRPTPLTGRENVGGGSRGKSPEPTPGPFAGSR